ncbi:MAG TPA: glycosyltransferase family 39 protein [Terriglobales bacterium]|nr:glycosyltransferase family 39 protein [Terriglobales bacterium]
MANARIAKESSLRRWWAQARTSFFWILLLAMLLRLGIILIGHTYKFKTLDDNFSFGWEMGRIGRSLALGQGFSNPFNEPSGPTAWEPPLYPFLIAGVFRLFGIYTHASALVLLAINSFFSALTCIPIFLISRKCFSEKVAIWGAWLWALLPNVTYWSTRWVWETSLAALFMAVIFWMTLTLEDREGWRPWIEFGLLWGIAPLTNTSLLAFLPASGLWIWYRRAKQNKRSLAGVLLASGIFFACITPWLIRNYRTFGQPVFIRSNFGAELRLGNGPGADGTWMEFLHPSQNVYEMRRYLQLGEIAYVKQRKQEALAFIQADYGRFALLDLKRFIYYWGGIPKLSKFPPPEVKNALFLASSLLAFFGLLQAFRKKRPGAWLFLWLILTYPAVYYFVFPHPRYRHPIEPELGMLIVYIFSEAESKKP